MNGKSKKQKIDNNAVVVRAGSKAADFMDKFKEKMTEGMKSIEQQRFTINEDNWVYSAPSISDDDIDQLDFYTDTGKKQVIQFLKDIKVCDIYECDVHLLFIHSFISSCFYKNKTTQMRNGGESADNGWLGLYNEEGGVHYHDVLWPHWCEFARADSTNQEDPVGNIGILAQVVMGVTILIFMG